MATLNEVKAFFGYDTLASFRTDWNKLDATEKAWFREAVKKAV